MRLIDSLRFRTATLFRRSELNTEMEDELRSHILNRADDLERCGLARADAERRARIEFGGYQKFKEECRESAGGYSFGTVGQDLRFAVRRLRNSPGFTTVAVVTLALGLGVTTSVFTLVRAVMLTSLPVPHPEELYRLGKDPHCCVSLGYTQVGEYGIVSSELYDYFRRNTQSFNELAAFDAGGTFFGVRRANGSTAAETYFGEFVSGNYFVMFGIHAFVGRALSADDDKPGAPAVAVMSYRAWKQKYGLDPSVIGSTFSIDQKPFTVVGITTPAFYGDRLTTMPPDFYLPLATEPLVKEESSLLRKADVHWLNVIGRARPSADVRATEAQMRLELQQWLRSHWGEMTATERAQLPSQTLNLAPGGAGITFMRLQYGDWPLILMLAASLALLIVCTNIANLSLARGMERRPQVSLSIALGASQFRLMQQGFTESIVLSLTGGAAGLAVAFMGTRLILHSRLGQRLRCRLTLHRPLRS